MGTFTKNPNSGMIRENGSAALLTMANDASVELVGPVLAHDFRILKSEGTFRLAGLTSGEGHHLELFMINSDLSTAEALEAINLNGPLFRNDRVPTEQSERFVRYVGVFDSMNGIPPTETIMYLRNKTGGFVHEFNPRWTFTKDASWGWLLVNRSGAALTTGATLRNTLTHYGVWLK